MGATSQHSAIALGDVTGYLPLVSYLEWDLSETTDYSAGQVLQCTLTLTNHQAAAKWLYVLGALFDEQGSVVQGSEFGVYYTGIEAYAVNNPDWVTAFEIEAESYATLPCRFTFPESERYLELIMLEMQGAEPATDDPVLGVVTTFLGAVSGGGIDITSLMTMMVMVMMVGMMIPIMGSVGRG